MMVRRWFALPAAALAAVALAGTLTVRDASAEDDPGTPAATPAPATETAGNPPLPIPPKPAAPVRKKRIVRRGDQGEKLTVAQVAEIMEEDGDLTGMDLRGLNLVGFNLRGAKLSGSTLVGANLERANLQEANLERANFGKANLKQASLQLANIKGANLEEANLEGAIWLDGSICGKGSIGTCRDSALP